MNVANQIMETKSLSELREFIEQLSEATQKEYSPMLLMQHYHLRFQELERRVEALEARPYPS